MPVKGGGRKIFENNNVGTFSNTMKTRNRPRKLKGGQAEQI